MVLRSRRAQAESPSGAAGAAFLILIIAVVMVIYILFLPPADREALLSEGGIPGEAPRDSGGYSYLRGSTPLRQQVGFVSYVDDETIDHELNSFTIYTLTEANLIKSLASVSVKNSAFDQQVQELPFTVDRRATENVLLSFNVERGEGTLFVYLNGVLLYEGSLDSGSPQPIPITSDLLKNDNLLFFAVSSPGFAFWSVNQYDLSNIKITGDVTDSSASANVQRFYIAQEEYEHIEETTLKFVPDCTYSEIGRMRITLNGEEVFYGLPDCGLRNFFTVGKNQLRSGDNVLEFVSDRGSYIIDQLVLEVDLEDAEYPVYYFELDEDLFTDEDNDDSFCGKVDGICLDGCESYEDKDCCFDDSRNNLWCDVKTNNPRDRCVNQVLANFADRCPSGYEDNSDDPAEASEGRCGDDTDDFCPIGCDSDLDKDCCFEISGAFWCDDVPLTGQDSVCTVSVTPAECNACPDGYRDEDRDTPNCPARDISNDGEEELKAGVDITLESQFIDTDYKRVDFIVNGNRIPVDTYGLSILRNINPYVREGANSLLIEPRKDVTIAEVRVTVE